MGKSSGSDSSQKQSYPGKGPMGVGGKEKTSKNSGFAPTTGSKHMFGPQGASPQQPGQTASLAGNAGGKIAVGGKTHMFGQQHAGPQAPGVTQTQSGADNKFVEGGKTHMFGPQSSNTAKPA